MMRRFSPGFDLFASIAPRFLRGAWAGAIALAVGLAATAGAAISTTRLYRSEAVLVFERGVQAGIGQDGDSSRGVTGRLNEMLNSRQRLESLIREMKLYKRVLDQRGQVEAVEEMRRRIKLSNREGYTYRVSYDGESRDLAKDVLTRLTASVVEEDNRRRNQDAEEARRFLDAERKQADEDLKQKEKALAEFLIKHPQLAAEAGAATTGGLIRAADRDRLGASGGEVASLELQAAQLEESLAAAGAPRVVGGRVVVGPSADSPLVVAHTRAQAELQAAQRDLVDKQLHLTNEHPDVKQAVRRMAVAEAAERRAAAALAAWKPAPASEAPAVAAGDSTAGARAAALRRALSAVRQQIASVKGRGAPRGETPRGSTAVVAVDTDWTRLNRDVAEARERQSNLEAKQFQANLAATLTAGGQGGQLLIVDPPFAPCARWRADASRSR
jgi:uncharacterized protein involved in exopolysaccharide biosynthesis